MASYNLYNKETKTLTQIAGTSVGVAKFGTPIQDWLVGHSSTATAITADRDGILFYFKYNGDTATPLVATLVINGKAIRGTRTSGWSSTITLPIRKGDVVYAYEPLSGDQSMFYPFAENVVQPIEGGIEHSTEETVIGTYLDKIHYARTFVVSDTSLNGEVSLDINGLQAGLNVTSISGTFKAIDAKYTFPVPYALMDTSESGGLTWYRLYTYYDTTTGNIIFNAKANQPNYYHGDYVLQLTVEYTKD